MAGKPRIRRERWTKNGITHYTENFYLHYRASCGTLIVIPLFRNEDACWRVADLVVEFDKVFEAGLKPDQRLLTASAALPEKVQQYFVKWGLIPKTGITKFQNLEALIAKWGDYLISSQASQKFVVQATARTNRVCHDCGFKVLNDIERSAVQKWIFEFIKSGKSTRTAETYIRSIRAWCNWLVEEGILTESPLKRLKGTMRVQSTIKKNRREFTKTEQEGLLSAALRGVKFRSMEGIDRWHLYACALGTGLRYGELYSLTVDSFNLNANPSTVTVEAGDSKHRRTDILPLGEPLTAILKEYFIGRDIHEKAFRGMLSTRGAEMIHHDLEVAGIPFKTVEGELDFHALRHTFISQLVRAGVNPKIVQSLARHSDPSLTLGRYSHVQLSELASALNKSDLS